MLESGKYKKIEGAERDRLYFVGDVKRPFATGKKGELFDMVDDEFFEILDLYKWHKCGMINLDIEKHAYKALRGVRALREYING